MELGALLLFPLMMFVSGWLFALPTYIPPLRRTARRVASVRYTLAVTLSGVLYSLYFWFTTYLVASIRVIFANLSGNAVACLGDCPFVYPSLGDVDSDAVIRELHLHLMLPPQATINCFSNDPDICHATQRLLAYDPQTWSGYLFTLAIIAIPALVCAYFVLRITRDNHKQKNDAL